MPSALSEANLLKILSLVRESGHTRAHYIGYADKSVILGLVAALGRPNVSIMDMHDRWGREAVFFWDEEDYGGLKPPTTPDWLEGISCYFEGGPNSAILLYDYLRADLDYILPDSENPFRAKPNLVLLFGSEFDAQRNNEKEFDKLRAKHSYYCWSWHDGILLGKAPTTNIPTS